MAVGFDEEVQVTARERTRIVPEQLRRTLARYGATAARPVPAA